MKICNSYCLLFTVMVGIPASASVAQTFDEYMHEQQQGHQQVAQEFVEYKNKIDADFAGFLKQQWSEFQAFKTAGPYKKPKPEKLPVARPIPGSEIPSPQPVPVDVKPQPLAPHVPMVPSEPTLPPATVPPKLQPRPGEMLVEINYFGNTLQFTYAKGLAGVRLPHHLDDASMSSFWQTAASTEHQALLNQLHFQQRALQLNDWAYVVLVNQFAQAVYPDRTNEQSTLSWFLLLKSGYKARIGYDREGNAFLLLPSKQMIQFASYLKYDGENYFVLNSSGAKQPRVSSLYSYKGNYQGADKAIDMRLTKAIQTHEALAVRKLAFVYGGKRYRLDVDYDRETVKFLHTYPQVSYEVFFESDVNRVTREKVLGQLRPMIKGMSERDAANFLVRMTQTSFKYETDQQQFGYEDSLFPEETIFYPASDCEDRAYFYAWLVRELLGLEVVGLLYPNHMATAVQFRQKVGGDSIHYQGKTYVISDPTYINADVGAAMPQFKRVRPEIIPLI